jgi:hypothetical protein
MLISLSYRFLFVANVKTASSSIEAALRPFAEIAISETRFGKHIGFAEIEERFDFIFRKEPLANFFKFAVVRDPLDMLISLYASHQKPAFEGKPHYTGGISFTEFLPLFRARQSWQLAPQASRLTDRQGRMRMDYLIDFDRLEEQFAEVLRLIGLPEIQLPRHNESPDVITRADIPPAIRQQIAQEYRQDRRIKRTLTGRLLRPAAARPAAAEDATPTTGGEAPA